MSEELEIKMEYWDNGRLEFEGHFQDVKPKGLGTTWYRSSAKKSKIHSNKIKR